MDSKKDIKEDYVKPELVHENNSESEKLPRRSIWQIFFILVLFVFVVTVGFFRSKSSTVSPPIQVQITPTTYVVENNGWKTYINREFGFSIKYPETYSFDTNISDDYISLLSPLEDIPRKGYAPTKNELKIEIYINSGLSSLDKPNLIEEREIMLGGKKATYIKWNSNLSDGETIQYYDNNRTLSIQKYPLTTLRQQEFEQILSTFTFLDEDEAGKCLPYVNPCDPESCDYDINRCGNQ